ncbi:MAG: hypothetical protein JRF69_07940 [Deltaproteobacteria bacterium]|nr:hypothetical protein [Deltaproteobacteria bacterium]
MKLQKNPSFRQVATVWHNSDPVCFIMSVFAAVVFYFSLAGVSVALENHAYKSHCWVPITLMFLSGILMITNFFRMLRRIVRRPTEEA